MKEKLKSFLADDSIYMASLLVVVGVLAFILGRLSVVPITQQNIEGVNPLSLCPTTLCPAVSIIETEASSLPTVAGQAISATSESTQTGSYVASKAGTKYHHISCPGAKQIKEENKIYFNTVQQALAAGYTKAANCNQ